MESVILNETPKRTSKSFGINNIKIDDFILPEIKEFNNVKIKSKIEIKNKKTDLNLKYNIGEKLTKQFDNANQIIYIDVKEDVKEPIYIEFELNEKEKVLVDSIVVNAKPNTCANIIIKYKSKEELTKGFHNGICNVFIGENAKIQVTILNLLNTNTSNYYTMNNKLEKNANLEYVIADFGGAKSITNNYSNLAGEKANAQINTMYIGRGEQLLDLNYISEVYGEKSNIDIEVYGALKDNSKKNFKGTIDFKTGCKKSIGNENEACMLLSKTAKAKALPMLLCSEEDVQGTHSNSAGKIDEEKLYYLMSRGISSEEAKKLIVKAKFSSIIEKIKITEIQQEIIDEIDRRLN